MEWLNRLELSQYTDLFKHNGYEDGDDIQNLKKLKVDDLKAMGITKRGNNHSNQRAQLHNWCPHNECSVAWSTHCGPQNTTVGQSIVHPNKAAQYNCIVQLSPDSFSFFG